MLHSLVVLPYPPTSLYSFILHTYTFIFHVLPPMPLSMQLEAMESGRVDTLFRGNTIACKVLSCSFKTFGLYYLQAVVRPLILQLLKSVDKEYEVDPTRLSDPSKLAQNQANLLELVQTFFKTIVTSLPSVPLQLRTVCHILYSVSSVK